MNWIVWAFLLIIQNASFTLVSRARNSGSLHYHALAAVFSNGVWIVSQFFIVSSILDVIHSGDLLFAIFTVLFYIVFTVIGSIGMHYASMRWLEVGKRKVGA